MIILSNHQLQNQCFRPSLHERSNSTSSPSQNQKQLLENIIELRKSQSSESSNTKRYSQSHTKDKVEFHLSNWMANHFLGDVKQKFKEIFKQRGIVGKKSAATARKNSVQSRSKQQNLSVICQSGVFTDKKKLMENHNQRPFQNKKLLELKKGRLFRGTQRDNGYFKLEKQIYIQNQLDQFAQEPIEIDLSDEDLEERYLKSQYASMKKQNKETQERVKTEKRTIQPKISSQLTKNQSEMFAKSLKRHSPAPRQNYLHLSANSAHSPIISRDNIKDLFEINKNSLNKQQYFMIQKRNSLVRRQQKKKQQNRIFKSKVSLQLNIQI